MFQSLSGLTLGLNSATDTAMPANIKMFQSLSGLTLGLNPFLATMIMVWGIRFNPFQG